jgi:acyl-CoA synthetase (AMP-forming)/AMP-acid ligase II
MGVGKTMSSPFNTTTEAFYYHAARFPNSVAICDLSQGEREFTYGELASRAQSLSKALRQLGVKPGQRIPLVVKRGVEMIVGIWAVLSCGAQYVPLDGGVVPDSTLRHVVEQAGGSVILCMTSTESRMRALLPDAQTVLIEDHWTSEPSKSSDAILDLATADGGCYVIYTSGQYTFPSKSSQTLWLTSSQGTTGKPKGVDVTHKNVSNLVCLYPGGLGVEPGMKVGSVLNISFDMGM